MVGGSRQEGGKNDRERKMLEKRAIGSNPSPTLGKKKCIWADKKISPKDEVV